jgi:hypothetical protein
MACPVLQRHRERPRQTAQAGLRIKVQARGIGGGWARLMSGCPMGKLVFAGGANQIRALCGPAANEKRKNRPAGDRAVNRAVGSRRAPACGGGYAHSRFATTAGCGSSSRLSRLVVASRFVPSTRGSLSMLGNWVEFVEGVGEESL